MRIHQCRLRVLLTAVDALASGRWLTLTNLARSWPDSERVAAPLKRLDRLLSNPRLPADGVVVTLMSDDGVRIPHLALLDLSPDDSLTSRTISNTGRHQ